MVRVLAESVWLRLADAETLLLWVVLRLGETERVRAVLRVSEPTVRDSESPRLGFVSVAVREVRVICAVGDGCQWVDVAESVAVRDKLGWMDRVGTAENDWLTVPVVVWDAALLVTEGVAPLSVRVLAVMDTDAAELGVSVKLLAGVSVAEDVQDRAWRTAPIQP